jgi:anti-sigma factor RsiW
MNRDFQLKLQAYLDGELPPQETERVLHSLTTDPEALALQEELKLTKSLLQGNELGVKLSESREFYWSKIRRVIERDNQGQASGAPQRPLWLRWFVPVGGLALFAILVAFSVKTSSLSPRRLSFAQEIETHLADISSISFRSESEGISVVWVNSQ